MTATKHLCPVCREMHEITEQDNGQLECTGCGEASKSMDWEKMVNKQSEAATEPRAPY